MALRLALVVLLAVVGCGTTVVDQAPTSTPTQSPTATTKVVGDTDSGSTIRVHPGGRIRVQLRDGSWDPPTSSAASVVARRSSSGGYPTDQAVDAVFEALRPGTADLSASSDAACFHTEPRCLMPSRLWQVHVVVTP